MRYRVDPGLYSLGSPTAEAKVFVTANYKLSFDHLRKGLNGLDAWILVLDTKGINVWCAAGKGTFGTDELVRRIGSEKLTEKVSHKNLIVPQLGAPGLLVTNELGDIRLYGGLPAGPPVSCGADKSGSVPRCPGCPGSSHPRHTVP